MSSQKRTSYISDLPGLAPALLGVVASTGGPRAVNRLLTRLPRPLPGAALIVQHLPAGFVGNFVNWLRDVTGQPVELAQDGQRLFSGNVVVAPDGFDLVVSPGMRVRLTKPAADHPHCPSGDALLSSLAGCIPRRTVGVVMTGMGADGAVGLGQLRKKGGITFTQDEASSVVYGMPKVAFESGASIRSLSLEQLPIAIAAAMEKMAGDNL